MLSQQGSYQLTNGEIKMKTQGQYTPLTREEIAEHEALLPEESRFLLQALRDKVELSTADLRKMGFFSPARLTHYLRNSGYQILTDLKLPNSGCTRKIAHYRLIEKGAM